MSITNVEYLYAEPLFQIKILDSGNNDINKSTPDGQDTPGHDYISGQGGTEALGGDTISVSDVHNPSPGASIIGVNRITNEYTPAWTDVTPYHIQVTLSENQRSTSSGTAWYKVYQYFNLPYNTRNSDIYGYIIDGTISIPSPSEISNSIGSLILGNNAKYTNKFSKTSGDIVPPANGIYIIWVKVIFVSLGVMSTSLRPVIFKYDARTPSATTARIDSLGNNIFPNEPVQYKITRTSGPEYYDRIKIWRTTVEPTGTQIKYDLGKAIPLPEFQDFPDENTSYSVKMKVRGINGVWSPEISGGSVDTRFRDPDPPIVQPIFDKGSTSVGLRLIDMRDTIAVPGSGSTSVTFKFYTGSTVTDQRVMTVQESMVNYDGKTRLEWTRPTSMVFGSLASYRWSVQYTNMNGTTSSEVFAAEDLNLLKQLSVTEDEEYEGIPYYMMIPEKVSDRKQIGIDVADVTVLQKKYKEQSQVVFRQRILQKPIYRVSLATSEELPEGSDIEYYLSFDDGHTYHQINPIDRYPVEGLPGYIIVNSGYTDSQKSSTGSPQSFVDMPYNPYGVILKAVLIRGVNETMTPVWHGYNLFVTTRDMVEKRL